VENGMEAVPGAVSGDRCQKSLREVMDLEEVLESFRERQRAFWF